jgi:hypothetical protein
MLFIATGFAQPDSSAGTLTGPLLAYNYSHASEYGADEIRTYKNKEGNHIIRWNSRNGHTLEFLLQGSMDGTNFRAIKRIIATSSGTGINSYEATVKGDKGYTHFRLIYINQTSNAYSKVVSPELRKSI